MSKDNSIEIISQFLKELHVPVSYQSIKNELLMHPNPESILAISDLLNGWAVPNEAYQINFDELIENQISSPFIAFVSNKEFVVVHEINKISFIISNQTFHKKSINIKEFENQYSGTILIAEKIAGSGEVGYKLKLRDQLLNKIRYPALAFFSVAILFAYFLANIDLSEPVLLKLIVFFVKTVGVFISIMLLIQSIDANNPLIQKICGKDAKKNCNAVLSSKAAQIFRGLSWSEIGFFYFSGTLLAVIFNLNDIAILQVLGIVCIASLPYTVYSIYYQWRIAKQWCILCCIIQSLFWLEFILFYRLTSFEISNVNLNEFLSLIICFFLPIAIWLLIKPSLQMPKEILALKTQLRLFKFNDIYFRMRLNDISEFSFPLLHNEKTLILGNPDADITITLVSNPYCSPCGVAHKTLKSWILNRSDVKLQIVFLTKDEENNPGLDVAIYLMSIRYEQIYDLEDVIDRWYEYKNFDKLVYEYPVKKIIPKSILDMHNKWCENSNTIYTPTIFVNGRQLPDEYSLEDIKYLV